MQHVVNGTDNMIQSHVNLMKTKVPTVLKYFFIA